MEYQVPMWVVGNSLLASPSASPSASLSDSLSANLSDGLSASLLVRSRRQWRASA